MREISTATQFFYFSKEGMIPVAKAADGETLCIATKDCYDNLLTDESLRHKDLEGREPVANPTSGPVFVEGAHPGDTLKVEILSIELADHATMRLTPGHGGLGRAITSEYVRIFPIKDGKTVDFNGRVLPLSPMIGVIGVAPREGCIDTDTPGDHGGNMDDRDITEGTTLYFPVSVEGAMFGLGDVHALMGDGEVCICGLEAQAKVTVRLSVIHGKQESLPVSEKDGRFAVIASAKTLDESAERARYEMLSFLHKRLPDSANDLILLLSLIGNLSVCQVVDPLQTVRFTLSEKIANLQF